MGNSDIADFLTRAQTRWQRPPAFVVLAGDATIDPRDYAGLGDADFVPTKMVAMDSVALESATDEWFGDLDDDGLAELALGRLPMRTVAHAETMVAKLVGYEQTAAGAWTKQVVLLSDADDPTWSFEADSATLAATLPTDYTAHAVSAGAGTAAARTELFAQVTQGQLLVNYLGHGSTTVWGKNADLLVRGDVTDTWRPGTRLPVVVAMNCLNGFFQGIYGEESLAETFLRAPEGAVATWASSSLTHAAPQAAANQAFFRLTFQGAYATLGETVVAAKGTVQDRDVRRSWIFFGDPAMRLKGVPHAPAVRDRLTATPTTGPVRAAGPDPGSTPADTDTDDAGTTGAGETAAVRAQHLADISGDGRADLFTYAPDTGAWTLARDGGDRTGTWTTHARLFAAHLTADRRADLVAYHAATGAWLQALTAADGTFTTQAGHWTPGWQVTAGDFRGTGRDDLFLSDPDTGVWYQAATTETGGFTYRSGQGLPVGDVLVADFNGDRYADLFIYDPATGRWFFGVNDTAGDFTYLGGDGAPAWRVHVANLDGNTWADLFLVHPASGAWVEWRLDTAWQITTAQGTWTPGGAVTVVDLDGNGQDDLFWYDAGSGQGASHLNRRPGTYTSATGSWPAGRSLGVGDLNGDHRADLVFYDATTGAWSRYLTDPAQDHPGLLIDAAGSWAPGLALVGRPE